MEIGEPIRIVTVRPLQEPVPTWPGREPISVPQEEPVLEPAKVEL